MDKKIMDENKKIGFIVKRNTEAESLTAVGFVPRNPVLRDGKNGLFKTFTLGVYLDESGDTVRWYSCTCDQEHTFTKGDWLEVEGETWERRYTNKQGNSAIEYRLRVDKLTKLDI